MISLASWNINKALTPNKLHDLTLLLSTTDVVFLQETSYLSVHNRQLINSRGFDVLESPGHHSGCCILLNKSLQPYVKKVLHHEPTGRALGVLLQLGHHLLLLASLYLPTSLDFQSSHAPDVLTAALFTLRCCNGALVRPLSSLPGI